MMDSLCFSHDFKETQFVIWQMKEFGVQESCSQLFRIDYVYLKMHYMPFLHDLALLPHIEFCTELFPFYLSKKGDTLMLAHCHGNRAIIYNRRDMKVERVRISNELCWFSATDYVESLVLTCSELEISSLLLSFQKKSSLLLFTASYNCFNLWSATLTPSTFSVYDSMVGKFTPIKDNSVIGEMVGDCSE